MTLPTLILAVALSQGLTPLAPGATGGGKVLWQAPFSVPGCYATGSTAGASSAIAITRATSATYIDANGDLQTCTTGQFRVAADGLLVEPARTQYVLNAATHPKTAEATGSLPIATQYVAWADSTLTVAAGTATVTGLSCTAVAAGTLCPFAVTGAGTMAITTTGGTKAQIENGPYRTSFISSAGTATARNADAVSATVPAVPSKWCIAVTAEPEEGRAWAPGGNDNLAWALGTSGANYSYLSATTWLTNDGTSVGRSYTYSAPTPASHRLVACNMAGVASLAIDGTLVSLTGSGLGTGQFGTSPTKLSFGSSSGSYLLGGYLKDLRIYKVTKPGDAR